MFRQLLNWRSLLALIAILIVSGTILYSSYLADKIEKDERKKVELWVEAVSSINNPDNTETGLASMITLQQKEIPIIETTEKDSITIWANLDSAKVERGWAKDDTLHDPNSNSYLRNRLNAFRSENAAIEWIDPVNPARKNKYYYGHSRLLDEVRYYPLIQLFIVSLFIAITVMALRSNYRSTQNQVWAGMAKETAHQLGTPVSSLEGWMEILKETYSNESFVPEMEKDVSRLRLVSDRFGKIGSTPQLEEKNIIEQVRNMVEYIRKRAGGKVSFALETHSLEHIPVKISAPLFDWVIENLLKNALDAMEGKGAIRIDIQTAEKNVIIDVSDTGKGISKQNIARVFKPGFTTKKRGWGLGLSLSKRIIEQYHKGSLTVKQSEPGKGTTFRIVLKK
ncbi:MAG: HAMP domain-containing histidine kinase [Flavisolibacter sp.]|nr:HAMP domain-containing histidine kinase [Flavisolibacter sp.]